MGLFDIFNPKNLLKAVAGAIVGALAVLTGFVPGAFLARVFSLKSLFVFGSSVILSAFSNRNRNAELPDVVTSTYGTAERAKTIYGEAVVGGLIADIEETTVRYTNPLGGQTVEDPGPYAVRYAIAEKKAGFVYTLVDVEVGGTWLGGALADFAPPPSGLRTFGTNGTGDAYAAGTLKFLTVPTSNDYRGKVEVIVAYGEVSDEDTLNALGFGDCGAEGDPCFTGKGLVWAVVRFDRSDASREFFRGQGQVRWESVRFRLRAQPPVHLSVFRTNPAEVLKLHLQNELDIPAARIDAPSFAAAATVCDTKRFSCDGFFLAGQEYQAISWILQTMGAALTQESGKFYLRGLDDPDPTLTVTEAMLLEAPTIEHSIAWRERYNKIRGEILDRSENWSRQATPEIGSDDYLTEDGGNKYLLDVGGLNFTNSQARAFRILTEELSRRRIGKTIALTVHSTDVPGISAYDNIRINLVKNGIDAKFRVLNVTHAIEGAVSLTCVSEVGLTTAVAAAENAPTITGLAATFLRYEAANSARGVVRLTWNDPKHPPITGYEARQRTGSGAWGAWTALANADALTTRWEATGLTHSTTYSWQVRSVVNDGKGAASNTATLTLPSLVSPPQGLTATWIESTDVIRLRWNLVTGFPPSPAVARLQYRWRPSGGTEWSHWSPSASGIITSNVRIDPTTTTTYDVPGGDYTFGRGETYVFQVRVTDRGNPVTSPSAEASVTKPRLPSQPAPVARPPAPASITVSIVDFVLGFFYRLSWPASTGATSYEWAWGRTTTPPASGWTSTGLLTANSSRPGGGGSGWYAFVRARNTAGTSAATRSSQRYT